MFQSTNTNEHSPYKEALSENIEFLVGKVQTPVEDGGVVQENSQSRWTYIGEFRLEIAHDFNTLRITSTSTGDEVSLALDNPTSTTSIVPAHIELSAQDQSFIAEVATQIQLLEDTSSDEIAEAKAELIKLLDEIPDMIDPDDGYLPGQHGGYRITRNMGDFIYLAEGCADGRSQILTEDDTLSKFSGYNSRGAKVLAGTHVLTLIDIKPFNQSDRIEDAYTRTFAKLHMTKDFLRLLWRAEDLDPEVNTVYGLTNPAMAKFMRDRWGFSPFRDEDRERLKDKSPKGDHYVMYAYKYNIERMYPALCTYIKTLQQRLKEYEDQLEQGTYEDYF